MHPRAIRFSEAALRIPRRLRGLLWTIWIRAWGGHVGRRLEVDSRAVLRHPPGPGILIGDDVYVGVGAVIDVHPKARLVVGSGAKLMHYVVIAASAMVSVGELTQIAEFSSVRDSDHGLEVGSPMRDQLISSPVSIGSDVWVARSVAVLRGVSIGDGAVIGANAVVRNDIPPLGIAVGVPARVVRERS